MDYSSIPLVMSELWAPLAAVSTSWRGETNAQIALAIAAASIVPDRPRVVVQLYKTKYTHELVLKSKVFALNFLREEQLRLLRDLGFVSGRDRDKLANIDWRAGATTSPVLSDCFGYLDCKVINAMDGETWPVFFPK